MNPRTQAAIGWYLARMGSSAWEGRCELTAELAYGVSGRYPTARANWDSPATAQHPGVLGAPRGALVFWSTSASGHVAISLGDGTVLSSSANGHIGRVPAMYFQNPLGWKEVPF
jgi:cell wall-associated NlpC family hydrolase